MPATFLWSVSNRGRVYLLSSQEQRWAELPRSRVDLKRVSALNHCAWALGCDQQIYLFVVATEIPIRHKEVAYENQRWNPKVGFSDSLLPTDRPRWSSQDGLIERHTDKIQLPSSNWAWESDWTIDDNLDGQPLGHDGWMYAFDFPTEYGKDMKRSSFVRRRRWFRYRDFVSVDGWILIPGIHADPFLESFVDISIGGLDIPGGDGDTLAVWAVTSRGGVMFRQGVTRDKPEGNGWIHIVTPSGCEILNVSVGPTGLVWALTDTGVGLARLGVSRQKLTGTDWVEIDSPAEKPGLIQVSVGVNAVWAIGKDNSVWFRKGIRGNESNTEREAVCGSGWVEMCGKMSIVTVGPNDQVWAVKKDEPGVVCFRTGITFSDEGGKTWKPIDLPLGFRDECKKFAPVTEPSLPRVGEPRADRLCEADSGICLGLRKDSEMTEDIRIDTTSNTKLSETAFHSASGSETSSPRLRHSSSSSTQESVMVTDDNFFDDDEISFGWMWLNGGACLIDQLNIPNWFQSNQLNCTAMLSWRNAIGTELSRRREREMLKFDYEEAIEKVAWKKFGRCMIWVNNRWIEGRIELEQMNSGDRGSILFVYYNKETLKVNLYDVTYVMCGSDQNRPYCAIFRKPSEKTNGNSLRLAFSSDTDLEDWVAVLSTACCEVIGFTGTPTTASIWATTTRGDVFAHDPNSDDDCLPRLNEMFWRQFGGHLKIIESCALGIVWGIGYNHVPYVYTGGWGGGFFKGLSSSTFGIHSISDTRQMYIYENQRWNPLTGFSSRGLPTDRYMWSDSSGKHECTKDNTRLLTMHWQWVMIWEIDFHAPGGVDKEGWQYAKDFPCNFHSRKGLTDYVRRRRWYRRCKLNTSGPWEALESVPLLDISFQIDVLERDDQSADVWAVDLHGNALYRHGVTKSTPRGHRWEHVTADASFCSVSVGADKRVWMVCRDGSAFFRSGITASNPTGAVWFHVEPPDVGVCLNQISVGRTSVWAVDTNGGLWFREEVMPKFPEGTRWKLIESEVHKVSVGFDDQMWVVAKSVNLSPIPTSGVICRRKNVTNEDKIGSGWEYGPGGGWNHVSIRGCTRQPRVDKT